LRNIDFSGENGGFDDLTKASAIYSSNIEGKNTAKKISKNIMIQ